MKKILFIFLIVIVSLVFMANRNNSPKVIIYDLVKKGQFQNSQLHYRIYLFGILPIGEAIFATEQLEEYQGQRVYHLNAIAKSLNVFSKFFKGEAILDSYVDLQQFNPMLFKERLAITNRIDIKKEIFYDQKEGVMSIAGVRRQIFPNTQDPLSAIFNFRRMDFDRIREFEMNINTNQKNYILKGTTEQKDLQIDKKIYKIILAKAEIGRRDKNPYHKSNITMVLLKGKENIPVLIKVFASGIFISTKLVEIK